MSLFHCGKNCRLRWANHLRTNLKKGAFSQEKEYLIVAKMSNRWACMAAHRAFFFSQLPGRTYKEIKSFWNTQHQEATTTWLYHLILLKCMFKYWSGVKSITKSRISGGQDIKNSCS